MSNYPWEPTPVVFKAWRECCSSKCQVTKIDVSLLPSLCYFDKIMAFGRCYSKVEPYWFPNYFQDCFNIPIGWLLIVSIDQLSAFQNWRKEKILWYFLSMLFWSANLWMSHLSHTFWHFAISSIFWITTDWRPWWALIRGKHFRHHCRYRLEVSRGEVTYRLYIWTSKCFSPLKDIMWDYRKGECGNHQNCLSLVGESLLKQGFNMVWINYEHLKHQNTQLLFHVHMY